MNRNGRFSWMIKPKGFIRLLGAEYELLRKAGGSVLTKFYTSAFLIFIIAVISFLSIRYAIELLFHIIVVEIFLSLFLSLLFVLMYVFLINTFTKDFKHRAFFNFSNITRVGFIVFMGYIISKPVEVYFFRASLDRDVALFQQELIQHHTQKVNALFLADVRKMQRLKSRRSGLNKDGLFEGDIKLLNAKIDSIDQKKRSLIEVSQSKIAKGGFFIYRVKKVSQKYRTSWMVCIAMIGLFLFPGYLIYSISKDDGYFKMKDNYEKDIVRLAYKAFCEKYNSMFLKYGHSIQFYTKYEDPPFNTKLRPLRPCKSAKEFHNKYAGR